MRALTKNAFRVRVRPSCYIARVSIRTGKPWFLRPALVSLVVLAALVSAGGLVYARLERTASPAVCDALARARIVKVLAGPGVVLGCTGIDTVELPEAYDALLGASDGAALASVLRKEKATALALVPGTRDRGLGKSLGSFAYVPGLTGVALSPLVAVYAPARVVGLDQKERDALVYVTRALLRGAREPSLSSFPPSLRRVQSVEVMVTLSQAGGAPILWRSARSTSIPRALLTATRVARDRWHERSATLGGPLRERLPSLDVSVSMLVEDGVLSEASPSLVDRAITKTHGLGFDYRSDWHYLVPADVQKRGNGSAHRALTELAKDYDLNLAMFAREDARLYRFVVESLGTSPASVP